MTEQKTPEELNKQRVFRSAYEDEKPEDVIAELETSANGAAFIANFIATVVVLGFGFLISLIYISTYPSFHFSDDSGHGGPVIILFMLILGVPLGLGMIFTRLQVCRSIGIPNVYLMPAILSLLALILVPWGTEFTMFGFLILIVCVPVLLITDIACWIAARRRAYDY